MNLHNYIHTIRLYLYLYVISVVKIYHSNIYSCPLVWHWGFGPSETIHTVPRFDRQIFYASVTVLNGLFLACLSGQDGSTKHVLYENGVIGKRLISMEFRLIFINIYQYIYIYQYQYIQLYIYIYYIHINIISTCNW